MTEKWFSLFKRLLYNSTVLLLVRGVVNHSRSKRLLIDSDATDETPNLKELAYSRDTIADG